MCDSCGCDEGGGVTITRLVSGLAEHHSHHQHHKFRTITLETEVLAKNDALAARNREYLRSRGILALNLVSSPGSGKTTLLERTIRDLRGELVMTVIEGDQQTRRDAERISATGAEVVQVNTGAGCHLDSQMVARAFEQLEMPNESLLFIENVGNLVCPATFDLGEHQRVILLSVPEGSDKPVKYPATFRSADLLLITKTDLVPYFDFSMAEATREAGILKPGLEILPLSATTGEGFDLWIAYLRGLLKP